MDPDIINYFHHIHHKPSYDDDELEHEVHHCGGDHAKINPEQGFHCSEGVIKIDSRLNYTINHCRCRKHRINTKRSMGHDVDSNEVIITFTERCPEGGYHVESGIIVDILQEK